MRKIKKEILKDQIELLRKKDIINAKKQLNRIEYIYEDN